MLLPTVLLARLTLALVLLRKAEPALACAVRLLALTENVLPELVPMLPAALTRVTVGAVTVTPLAVTRLPAALALMK